MNKRMVPNGTQLPCGCILGSFLCHTAEYLWAEVNRAYGLGGMDAAYLSCLAEYGQHFAEAEDGSALAGGSETI